MSYAMIPTRSGSSSFGNSGLFGLGDIGNNAMGAFMQSLKNAQMFYDYQDRQQLNPYYMQATAAGLDASAAQNAGKAAEFKTDNMVWNAKANSYQAAPGARQQMPQTGGMSQSPDAALLSPFGQRIRQQGNDPYNLIDYGQYF